MYRNGEWGTVCDISWDVQDGNVVCRALGYGTAKEVRHRASFGRGVGLIHYSQLRLVVPDLPVMPIVPGSGEISSEFVNDILHGHGSGIAVITLI